MKQVQTDNAIHTSERSDETLKLIRKLRWMGLEEEATRLQFATRSLPPDQRGTVPIETFGTD
jgi:hypothetical protein